MAFVVSLAFLFPDAIGAYLLTHNEFMMFVVLLIVHGLIFLVAFKLWSSVSLAISAFSCSQIACHRFPLNPCQVTAPPHGG